MSVASRKQQCLPKVVFDIYLPVLGNVPLQIMHNCQARGSTLNFTFVFQNTAASVSEPSRFLFLTIAVACEVTDCRLGPRCYISFILIYCHAVSTYAQSCSVAYWDNGIGLYGYTGLIYRKYICSSLHYDFVSRLCTIFAGVEVLSWTGVARQCHVKRNSYILLTKHLINV